MNINKTLLKLDGPVLKSDSPLAKIIKRKILKPIGFYFRKKNFNKIMNSPMKLEKEVRELCEMELAGIMPATENDKALARQWLMLHSPKHLKAVQVGKAKEAYEKSNSVLID